MVFVLRCAPAQTFFSSGIVFVSVVTIIVVVVCLCVVVVCVFWVWFLSVVVGRVLNVRGCPIFSL